MKLKFKKLIFVLVFFALSIVVNKTLAIGQLTEPIVVAQALRNQIIEDELLILNTENTTFDIDIQVEGDIVDWVTFYSLDNPDDQINTVTLKAKTRQAVPLRIVVPNDTPNGQYKGVINILGNPAEQEEIASGAIVSHLVGRDVVITVIDEEIVDLDAAIIPAAYKIQEGENLSLRVIYYNNGNIAVRPQLQVKIINSQEVSVYNAIYPYPETVEVVKPLLSQEIPAINLPTMDFTADKYYFQVDVLYKDEILEQEKFSLVVGDYQTDSVSDGRDKQKRSAVALSKLPNLFWLMAVATALVTVAIIIGAFVTLRQKSTLKKESKTDKIDGASQK